MGALCWQCLSASSHTVSTQMGCLANVQGTSEKTATTSRKRRLDCHSNTKNMKSWMFERKCTREIRGPWASNRNKVREGGTQRLGWFLVQDGCYNPDGDDSLFWRTKLASCSYVLENCLTAFLFEVCILGEGGKCCSNCPCTAVQCL